MTIQLAGMVEVGMARYYVCEEDDVPLGKVKAYKAGGRTVAIFHLHDGFYSTQNDCSHLFAPLHKGTIIEGSQIECPYHQTRFDIRTGAVMCWADHPLLDWIRAKKALKTYPVTVEAGQVFVEL